MDFAELPVNWLTMALKGEKFALNPEKQDDKDEQLTKREETFCQEYVVDHNATRAAITAGYGSGNTNAAAVAGSKLLMVRKIRERITEIRAEFKNGFNPFMERIILELRRQALWDPKKMYNEDGSIKKIHELDDDTAAAIAGFEVVEMDFGDESLVKGLTKKVKMANKIDASALIAKLTGAEPATKTDITSGGAPLAGVAVVQLPSNGRQAPESSSTENY